MCASRPSPSQHSSAGDVKRALGDHVDPEKAAYYPRFFKCGPGEYGEGDRFLGVTVPSQRRVARQFRDLPLTEIETLLLDRYHECRLTALIIMSERVRRGDRTQVQAIVRLYLEKMDRVNNWDLVDCSADKILGEFLLDEDRTLLDRLAAADDLWQNRIAMIATYRFIKEQQFEDTLRIAETLLEHPHDLIHKAVGWMLREVGKRDQAVLEAFLDEHGATMPRTMLRYAIERLPEKKRQRYLHRRA